MKYKCIIFDWDGTLMDSAEHIVKSIQASATHMGLTVPTVKEAKDVIGISLLPALQKLFKIEDLDTAQNLVRTYKEYFSKQPALTSVLFPGAINLLAQLQQQNYLLAVATGKGREGLNKAWQDTHSGQYFVSSRSADDALSKPSPDMLQQILQELGLMPNEVLMVGDTTYDMAMAEAINVDRVAVSFGVHEAQRLQQHKPLAIIDKLEDLLNFV